MHHARRPVGHAQKSISGAAATSKQARPAVDSKKEGDCMRQAPRRCISELRKRGLCAWAGSHVHRVRLGPNSYQIRPGWLNGDLFRSCLGSLLLCSPPLETIETIETISRLDPGDWSVLVLLLDRRQEAPFHDSRQDDSPLRAGEVVLGQGCEEEWHEAIVQCAGGRLSKQGDELPVDLI